ncbi:MAG: BatA and WFA domain-containing protein, partial [Tepidisphaeraceae bacterium]
MLSQPMFGLNFLFSAALWALPLAAVPVLIHLIVRRKAPLVPFSTLRFIRSSLRQTAGKRRIRRWSLLSCRIALLALLIWAVAQPTRQLAAAWLAGPSVATTIVVDTSYSMALRDGSTNLLTQADQTVNQILSQNLQNARVAIFTSRPNPSAEQFQSSAAILTNWKTLALQPALSPLADRVSAAAQLLQKQPEPQKWLIIVTDLQTREFPAPLPQFPGLHTVLVDLHPQNASSSAIVDIHTDPAQPRTGLPSQIAIQVLGRPGESVAVNLSAASLGSDQPQPPIPPIPLAHLDSAGRATLRVPFTFSASPWTLLSASLQTPDRLPWAAGRTQLIYLPPPAIAQVLPMSRPNLEADEIVRLALDPSQGARPDWPIALQPPGPEHGNENLLVANVTQWPDESTANHWSDFARRGGILILFIQPGLEQSWTTLPPAQQSALQKILPGAP